MATRVKGSAMNSAIRYVKDNFGEDGLKKVLEEMPEQERDEIKDSVLVSSWYPWSCLLHFMRATDKLFGAQTSNIYEEFGKASCDYGVTTVYKIFFKVGSPQFIIGKASTVFKNYYDTGDFNVVDSGKGYAIMELTGFEEPAPELCLRITGWAKRLLELSGSKALSIDHTHCVNRGDATCKWDGTWN